jgi:type IV pilus assembly protein PilY1
MHRCINRNTQFKTTIIAAAVIAAMAPHSAWSLDLSQSPPGTKEPYVAPNLILSLDDSTSMNAKDMIGNTKTRTQVLKESLIEVFSDTTLLPEGKIRFAWQTMGNCTSVGGSKWAPNLDATAAPATTGTNKNVMRKLDATHRGNFLSYMTNYTACTNTPTHLMVKRADEYMRATLHENGPWASVPGTTGAPYLGCRRNFHVLLTDGGWNSSQQTTPVADNYDNQNLTFPDGTVYNSANADTRVYRDSETSSTIADWSFRSWATPLQTSGLTGTITPRADYENAPASETFTNRVTNRQVTLPKYWNPKYDPARWPHMVTYTIGFSSDALPTKNYNSVGTPPSAAADKNVVTPSSMLPYDFDGSFAEYANGMFSWRAVNNDRGHDMWHAAINSRGRFFAVEKGEDLAKAFRMIIGELSSATEPDRGSAATSGSNASRNAVAKYIANYVPVDAWRGYVEAETVRPDGTTIPTPGWGGKTTADLLDAAGFDVSNRLILSYSNEIINPATGLEKGGVPFKWAGDQTNLSTAQKNFLNLKSDGTSDALGEDRLNYVRGDRSKEGTESPPNYSAANPFRERKSRQGSIVNSEVWYIGAPSSNYSLKGYAAFTRMHKTRLPMIYVGGNDGMLHGFSGADGTEKLAYVPKGVLPALGRLADPSFNQNHRYYVDGSAMSGDVDIGVGDQEIDPTYLPNWRTLLVGTLGGGGKGYFVLDVTEPGTTAPAAGNFTEANAQQLVVMDKTRHASEIVATVAACEDVAITPLVGKEACLAAADMGHIFAKPVLDETNPQRTTQIVRMNNKRWAVVMGNGYNSKSERPVLLIQYLDGDKKLLRLVATGNTATGAHSYTTENGLSAPRLVDINSDGRPDVVYAGDIKGNLWKFLIADSDETNWGVARWGTSADTTSNQPVANGVPLFSAMGGTEGSPASRTLVQPITAVPTVRTNDRKKEIDIGGGKKKTVAVGGMMVAFGTGRNVTTTDAQNANKQSLYSVLDNTSYKLVGAKKDRVAVCAEASPTDDCKDLVKSAADLPTVVAQTDLVQRSIPVTPELTRDGHQYWTVDATTVLDWTTNKGWYMDLPQTRERLLKPMEFYDNSNLLAVFSQVPAKGSLVDPTVETCEAGSVVKEQQYLTLLNIMDGKRPSVQILDTNGDGKYNLTADKGASRVSVAGGSQTLIQRGDKIRITGKKGDGSDDNLDAATLPEQSLRPSWRQLR